MVQFSIVCEESHRWKANVLTAQEDSGLSNKGRSRGVSAVPVSDLQGQQLGPFVRASARYSVSETVETHIFTTFNMFGTYIGGIVVSVGRWKGVHVARSAVTRLSLSRVCLSYLWRHSWIGRSDRRIRAAEGEHALIEVARGDRLRFAKFGALDLFPRDTSRFLRC